jgi:hypothetical protein
MATFPLGGNQVKRVLCDFANSVGERNNYTLGRLPPTAVATTGLKATDVAEYYVGCFISPCFRGRLWSAVAAFEKHIARHRPKFVNVRPPVLYLLFSSLFYPLAPSRHHERSLVSFVFASPSINRHIPTSKVTSCLSCRWRQRFRPKQLHECALGNVRDRIEPRT